MIVKKRGYPKHPLPKYPLWNVIPFWDSEFRAISDLSPSLEFENPYWFRTLKWVRSLRCHKVSGIFILQFICMLFAYIYSYECKQLCLIIPPVRYTSKSVFPLPSHLLPCVSLPKIFHLLYCFNRWEISFKWGTVWDSHRQGVILLWRKEQNKI